MISRPFLQSPFLFTFTFTPIHFKKLPQMAEANNSLEENSKPNCLPPSSLSIGKKTLTQDMIIQESPEPLNVPKQVVVIMDGLKEFSMEPLEWVLKNVADGSSSSCIVTLLGVMPWLNIPLSSKTSSDIWSIDMEDLSMIKEWKNDAKYHKVRVLLDICQHYGAVLDIRTEMGHPLHLLVVEQINSLNATLVVFDRHHDTKYIEYYAEKVPCKMVKMKEDGQVEMIRGRSRIDSEEESTPRGYSFNFGTPTSSKVRYFQKKSRNFLSNDLDANMRVLGRRIWKLRIFHFGMCLNGSRPYMHTIGAIKV